MNPSIIARAAFAALILFAAACASDPKGGLKPGAQRTAAQERVEAEKMYRSAREALDSNDMNTALERYNKLALQFPFSEFATQGDLERVYALYRNYQPEQAISAADKFIREHPRHPGAAYAQYLKGLTNSSRDQGLAGFIGLDTTKEDVSFLRTAFDDFGLLVRKYPTSAYVGDSRQHMIDLRNRIAEHELHIVRFYIKRGAYVAAAKRAEQIITQYSGAPATLEALRLLQESYRAMNLNQQADDAAQLLAAHLAQPGGQSDYPGSGTGQGLPESFKDNSPVRVVPIETSAKSGDTWLDDVFSIFGGKDRTPAPTPVSKAKNQSAPLPPPITAAVPAPSSQTSAPSTAADGKPEDDANLLDVLKATFGRGGDTSPAPALAAPAPLVPVSTEGKTKPTAGKTPVQVVPVAKDDSEPVPPPAATQEEGNWFSKLLGTVGAQRQEGNLAPGGRHPPNTTPLLPESPQAAPPAAPTPTPAKPAASTNAPKKKGNWFTKLFSVFDTSESEGHTVVIPTNSTPAPKPSRPATVGLPPAAVPKEASLDDALADKPASAPATNEKPKSNFSIEMEPYDDATAKKSAKPVEAPKPSNP